MAEVISADNKAKERIDLKKQNILLPDLNRGDGAWAGDAAYSPKK